jgi:hypothetical protein
MRTTNLGNMTLVLLAALTGWPAAALLAADAPDVRVIRTPFYRLHHDAGNEADARKAREVLDDLIKALGKEFAGQKVDDLLRGIDCDIYLHAKPTDDISEGSASLESGVKDGKYVATIRLLTPSAFRPGFRSSIGEPGGDDYFAKVLVHEYATILLERATRAKDKGWRFYDAPGWFVQGYEEYLGLTLSTPHNRNDVLAKYLALQKGDPLRVRIGFGVGVKDPYLDGAVLLHFMHEAFGKDKVQAILTSDAPTFEAAAGPALGVTLEEFRRRWEEWRAKLP